MNLKLPLKAWLLMCSWVMLQHTVQAQFDFREGYIISHERDTTFGLLNFHDGVRSFEVCEFKRTAKGESTKYLPADILGYGFTKSRRYLSRTTPEKDGNEKVFMEVIAYGRIILLRHREAFWIEKEGATLTKLRNDMVTRNQDGDSYRVHSQEYIGVLNILMQDCSDVQPRIAKTPFYQRNLVKLVESYNNCGNKEAAKTHVDTPWLKVIPGIVGVGQYSSIDVSDLEPIFGDVLEQTEKEVSPIIGITVDFFSPRISERFLFNTSLWYSASTYYLSGKNPTATHYAIIDLDEIKMPLGIRYTIAPRVVTPYVNIGISTTFTIQEESKMMLESKSANVVSTFDEGELPLKSMSFGFWGGVGVLVQLGKKMDTSIELRYERTDGLVDTGMLRQYSSRVTNLQLLIALRLNSAQ